MPTTVIDLNALDADAAEAKLLATMFKRMVGQTPASLVLPWHDEDVVQVVRALVIHRCGELSPPRSDFGADVVAQARRLALDVCIGALFIGRGDQFLSAVSYALRSSGDYTVLNCLVLRALWRTQFHPNFDFLVCRIMTTEDGRQLEVLELTEHGVNELSLAGWVDVSLADPWLDDLICEYFFPSDENA